MWFDGGANHDELVQQIKPEWRAEGERQGSFFLSINSMISLAAVHIRLSKR